ncbi:hypothetical protein ACQVP2_07415 [Methylobacterium aquaticum]|uniref:hypothetical protein n=1 Tax=Methylobacterium aquaticum TaxID=270351 RepID=UPI003D17701E
MAPEPRLARILRLGLQVADHVRAAHPGFLDLPSGRRDALLISAARAACGPAAKRDRVWVYCAAMNALMLALQIRLNDARQECDRAERRGRGAAPVPAEPAPPGLPFG